jgi:predicted AlkP superfamily pyrophosphatase or phosphodiesterase
MKNACSAAICLLVAAVLAGRTPGASGQGANPPLAPHGKTTVIWISMDGFRGDYVDRTALPFFDRLMKAGVYSRRFRPVFPPITFSSHCAEATGAGVDRHGIPGNDFYDRTTRISQHFPADASLLQAEPIWLTAERQGVRTLVFDWPLSQKQTGPVHDEYFDDTFDNAVADAQRLDHVLAAWRQDDETGRATKSGGPLRLLMGYVEGTDPAGHKFGPDAPEITLELQKLDREMGEFADKAHAYWQERAGPADRLYLLLTTDHGMSNVAEDANLEKMLGLMHGQKQITLETGGGLGNIFLDRVPSTDRAAQAAALMEKLKAYPFARVYRRTDLPPAWNYDNPTRTGDIVVVLPRGYTFNRGVTQPVVAAAQAEGPKGMHGYPVEEDPEMCGVMFMARYPQPFGGQDLGEVNWDQYHPTVAKLLGIEPAPDAKGKPIPLPGE